MPSPKRWFPVSHDIFDDPEILEMVREFGDRSLFTWLWFLSALDRSDNRLRLTGEWLRSLSRRLRQTTDSLRRQLDWMLSKGWLTAVERTADGSPAILEASNFWKYHRRRELNGNQPGANEDPSLPNLPQPRLYKPNRTLLDAFEVTNDLREWALKEFGVEIPDDVVGEFKSYWRNKPVHDDWTDVFKGRIRTLVEKKVLQPKRRNIWA